MLTSGNVLRGSITRGLGVATNDFARLLQTRSVGAKLLRSVYEMLGIGLGFFCRKARCVRDGVIVEGRSFRRLSAGVRRVRGAYRRVGSGS